MFSANRLIDHLNAKRKEQWISTVESIDTIRSSRRAWSAINKLTGRKNVSPNPNSISPNAVASCLLNNGKFKNLNRQFTREVNGQLKEEWNSPSADQNLCEQFMDDEIIAVIKSPKAGKAPGADNSHPEFFLTSMKTAFNGYDHSSTSFCTRKKYLKYGNLQKWLLCLNQRNHQMSQAPTDQLAYFVFLLSFTNA